MNGSLKKLVCAEVDSIRERLIGLSDRVHSNPEIGYKEYDTSQLYTQELERRGFKVLRGIAGMPTAFKAICQGREGGPRIALLAEMDCLPSLGHACGHNIIGAASVGAAIGLKTFIPRLRGTVMVFGTPAEEAAVDGAGGKVRMLKELKEADISMLVHPGTRNMVRSRNVCREALKIEFHGKAAHAGSAPHLGVNALDAALNTFNLVNALRQHLKNDVRIHAIISRGGDSPNIVPSYAEIRMYVRAVEEGYLGEVVEKVKKCVKGAALGAGAQVDISTYAARYLSIVNNPTLAELFQKNWERLGLTVEDTPERNYGSTDMGNVSREIPALHPYVAIAPRSTPGHSPAFREASVSRRGHEGLVYAAKGLAMTVIDLFTTPSHFDRVMQDFEAYKTGQFTDY